MKQTLEEHKTQLDGIAESLKKEAAFINSWKKKIPKTETDFFMREYIINKFNNMKSGHAEYQRQYDEAVRRGLKKFDRDKFLK